MHMVRVEVVVLIDLEARADILSSSLAVMVEMEYSHQLLELLIIGAAGVAVLHGTLPLLEVEVQVVVGVEVVMEVIRQVPATLMVTMPAVPVQQELILMVAMVAPIQAVEVAVVHMQPLLAAMAVLE
jgi:hypothetical protein